MKKRLKRCLTLAVVLCLMLPLCACSGLDELRAAQAFYSPEGDISWGGNTYVLLENSADLYPDFGDDQVYLTEADVPVLLSMPLAINSFWVSTDGKFLLGEEDFQVYCRADIYEELLGRINGTFTPDLYCYFYDVYNEETWDFEEKYYTLTQEQLEAMKTVTGTVEPYSAGTVGLPAEDYSVSIYGCSQDMLLQKSIADILATTAGYSLVVYTDTDTLVFPVPEGMNDVFAGILKTYVESGEDMFIEEEAGI